MNYKEKPITVTRVGVWWGSVPQSLIEDSQLSPTARLVACWFCIQNKNWVLSVGQMRRVLGIKRDADLAARKQLTAAGYLKTYQPKKNDGSFGRLRWQFDAVPAVAAVSGLAGHGSAVSGATVSGQDGGITGTPNNQGKRKNKQPPPQQEGGGRDLIFPSWVCEDIRPACLAEVACLAESDAQMLLDEMDGAHLAASKPPGKGVELPARYLGKLVSLLLAGEMRLEHADSVRTARHAKQRHLARLSAVSRSAAPLQVVAPGAGTSLLRNELLNQSRARMGVPPKRENDVDTR